MADHFLKKGLPVPKVLLKSENDEYYIQEDLGDTLLFNAIEKGRKTSIFDEDEKMLLRKTMRLLPDIQFSGAEGMCLWFIMMAVVGLLQLAQDWSVLLAFNPYYAIRFIIEVPDALIIMGSIFLCTTGAEALYSDLGHCGLKNIRAAWQFFFLLRLHIWD